jgi:hypothetical protein
MDKMTCEEIVIEQMPVFIGVLNLDRVLAVVAFYSA